MDFIDYIYGFFLASIFTFIVGLFVWVIYNEIGFKFFVKPQNVHGYLIKKNYFPSSYHRSSEYITEWDIPFYGQVICNDRCIYQKARSESDLLIKVWRDEARVVAVID